MTEKSWTRGKQERKSVSMKCRNPTTGGRTKVHPGHRMRALSTNNRKQQASIEIRNLLLWR